MSVFRLAGILLFASLCLAANAERIRYIGPETCALCHRQIAANQSQTAMASTWQGAWTSWLPGNYDAHIAEGSDSPVSHAVRRQGDRLIWTTSLPGNAERSLPVEVIMGGQRHGLGFLARVEQLDGIPLQRPALIQTRYAWSLARNTLLLAPGCPPNKPGSYETAFGLVLSPTFESKCLVCHGKPRTLGAGKQGGVRCESCHGPGSQHLQAVGKGAPLQGIVNPARMNVDESIAVCAQCHVGLAKFSDPSPGDLLVANQVRALESSECFIQSGKSFTCITCHNAHGDAASDDTRSLKACLGCHSPTAKPHAAICPVNASDGCIGCHMPSVELGALHLVDHLIRVHPEQGVKTRRVEPISSSQIRPLREFLRIIATKSRAKCETAEQRLGKGETFYDVAHDVSIDPSAPIGGYLGPQWLSQMDPAMAAAAATLQYGQTSGIVAAGERYIILERLARDFRWHAEQLQQQAEALVQRGDAASAIAKSQEALKIYPHFLRALLFIGTTFAENGNVQRASEVLRIATRLYPNDAGAHFELGLMLGALGRDSETLEAYRSAIGLEPDLLPVYAKLGVALGSNGEWENAIKVFREGLEVNPLSAELYYDLSLALQRSGDAAEAAKAMALATRIDPGITHQIQ